MAALLLAFLLLALQRQKAQVRYAAAVVAQLTVLVAALTTFTIYFRWDAKTAVQIAGPQTMAQVQETLSRAVAETPWETWQQQFTLYFDRHLPLIVTLWLVGVLVFSLRLLGAWAAPGSGVDISGRSSLGSAFAAAGRAYKGFGASSFV